MPSRRNFLRFTGLTVAAVALKPAIDAADALMPPVRPINASFDLSKISIARIPVKATPENWAEAQRMMGFQEHAQSIEERFPNARILPDLDDGRVINVDAMVEEWGRKKAANAAQEAARYDEAVDAAAQRESFRYACVTPKLGHTGYNVTLKRRVAEDAQGTFEPRGLWQERTNQLAQNLERKLPGIVKVDNAERKRGRLIVLTEPGSPAERYFQRIIAAQGETMEKQR